MFIDLLSAPLALFGNFGMQEMLIVAGVFLLLFGSTRLPSLMRNMGRSINEFKAGMHDKPGQTKISGDGDSASED
jgi:sec-independent protein translocase protein TatA